MMTSSQFCIPGQPQAVLALLGARLALPQGFGRAGLAAAASGSAADRDMLRPPSLHRRVLQIDPSTALAAAASVALRAGVLAPFAADRIGIVLATRFGSAVIARQFSDRVRRGSAAPALFAAAGYNAGAGLSAMAAAVNGPSVALSGMRASLQAAIDRCRQLILRGDADAMIAIVAESEATGGRALAAAVAVCRYEDKLDSPGSLNRFDPAQLQAYVASVHLLQATEVFPWLRADAAAVLAFSTQLTQ